MNTRVLLPTTITVASFFTSSGQSAQDASGAESQPSRLIVNPDTRTNDSKPSLAALAEGERGVGRAQAKLPHRHTDGKGETVCQHAHRSWRAARQH